MALFNRLFGKKTKPKKEAKSPYSPKKKQIKELEFAQNFTDKGGKFLYSESSEVTRKYFLQILNENGWDAHHVVTFSKNLKSFFQLPDALEEKKVQLMNCEYMIANTGGILICSKQIQQKKLSELPENLIIVANALHFVNDVSEAMTLINTKYKNDLPTNITTLNTFDPEKENDFLSYGSSSKNLYLLVQDAN